MAWQIRASCMAASGAPRIASQLYDSSAAFRFEVPKQACRRWCRNFKSVALGPRGIAQLKSPKGLGSDDVSTDRADQNPYRNAHKHRQSAPNVPIACIPTNKETNEVAQPRAKDHRGDQQYYTHQSTHPRHPF